MLSELRSRSPARAKHYARDFLLLAMATAVWAERRIIRPTRTPPEPSGAQKGGVSGTHCAPGERLPR
jgi:hypothetical protein